MLINFARLSREFIHNMDTKKKLLNGFEKYNAFLKN